MGAADLNAWRQHVADAAMVRMMALEDSIFSQLAENRLTAAMAVARAHMEVAGLAAYCTNKLYATRESGSWDALSKLRHVVPLVCAFGLGAFVWAKSQSPPAGLVSRVVYGAVVVGAIGFAAGFFGPLLFAPKADQGPLLAILITGPLGALLGGIGGAVTWWVDRADRERAA